LTNENKVNTVPDLETM